MSEKKIFQEIPGGRNKFHSAILTSFAFSFHHFEYQVLKTLKQKWITNVSALVDLEMLNRTIGLASGGLKQLTQSYSINGIKSKGVFHPKINFLVGDNELMMILGSGNITTGGHGKNHETFTTFYVDSPESPLLPFMLEGWNYIQSLSEQLEGYSKERITSIIPRNCSLLRDFSFKAHSFYKIDQQTEIALVYNSMTSIFSQVLNLIPLDQIDIITIVCPYYDENGAFLLNLIENFQKAILHVYIPNDFGLPPNKMLKNSRIKFFAWESTKRGTVEIRGGENYVRKLHGKIFNFQTQKFNYTIIGSTNATVAAFGTETVRGANDEFCVLYKSSSLGILNELGITGLKSIKDISTYSRRVALELDSDEKLKSQPKLVILGCDLEGVSIKLFLKQAVNEDGSIVVVNNDFGKEIFSSSILDRAQRIIIIKISQEILALNPAYVVINNNDGIISNKQVINYLDKLYHTDPSKENRTIQGLIGALESGYKNEFQILEYLMDLNTKTQSLTNINSKAFQSKTSTSNIIIHAEMTYEEAVEASLNKDSREKLMQIHNTIKIWQILSNLFYNKKLSLTDELFDEEEDGEASIGKDRKISEIVKKLSVPINTKEATSLTRKTEKLALDFINSSRIAYSKNESKINEITLCQFLVVSHVITTIHHFTKFDSKHDKLRECESILKNNYHTIMQKVLLAFASIVLKHDLENYSDTEYKQEKLRGYIQALVRSIVVHNYLINGGGASNPHSQLTDLACLTIFKKLGIPDSTFNEYIESISKSNADMHFNFSSVIRLKNRLLAWNSVDDENIFYHPQYGACLIKEKKLNDVRFKSILDPTRLISISMKEFIKLIPNSLESSKQ